MNFKRIYGTEVPPFIQQAADSKAMLRLKDVGMDCGCEYTSLACWKNLEPYKRYEHSLAVGMIAYRFSHDEKVALAGVFHDIATPVFAHVIDFMNHDYLQQESTEKGTREIIENDPTIVGLLQEYGLSVDDVCDYHLYPIADNDSPKLSADRLEYTLTNQYRYAKVPLEQVKAFYEDLTVVINEEGEQELAFRDFEIAEAFTEAMMVTSKVYVQDEDRYSMDLLGQIVKEAVERECLTLEDLHTEEQLVIAKMMSDEVIKEKWLNYRAIDTIEVSDVYREGALKTNAKKRYINPLVVGKGRIYDCSTKARQLIDEFLNKNFDYYVYGYKKGN